MCADGGGQRETGLRICAGAGWWPEHWPRPTPSSVCSRLLGSQGTEQLSPGSGWGDHVPTSRAGTADLLAAGPSWHLPTTLLLGINSNKTPTGDGPAPGTSDRPSPPQPASRIPYENPTACGPFPSIWTWEQKLQQKGSSPSRFLGTKREEN